MSFITTIPNMIVQLAEGAAAGFMAFFAIVMWIVYLVLFLWLLFAVIGALNAFRLSKAPAIEVMRNEIGDAYIVTNSGGMAAHGLRVLRKANGEESSVSIGTLGPGSSCTIPAWPIESEDGRDVVGVSYATKRNEQTIDAQTNAAIKRAHTAD